MYIEQNFKDGQVLTHDHLNKIEKGIIELENSISNIDSNSNKLILTKDDFVNGTYSGTELQTSTKNRIRTNWIAAKRGSKCYLELQSGWEGYIAIQQPDVFQVATDWVYRFEYEFAEECNFIVVLKASNNANITPDSYTSSCYITHPSSIKNNNYEVKSYYLQEIEDTLAKVKDCLTEPCLVFPLFSDIHYMHAQESPTSINDTVSNIRAIGTEITYDFVCCMGDIVEGDTPSKETLVRADHLLKKFKSIGVPYYPCIGNHDDNRYKSGDFFNHEQLYRAYIKNTHGVDNYDNSSMKGTNYYKDFKELGIRCFFLNANTNNSYGYSNDTVEWFRNNVESCEHRFIVFTHISPVPNQNYGKKYGTDSGSTQIREICANNDKFIMLFSGHNHYDASFTEPFLSFTINCQKFENENGDPNLWADGAVKPQREVGTATEDCFDIVIVRPTSKIINRIRFGAGNDQEYTYL